MSKFEKKFFSLLKEREDVDALNAGPEDDASSFDNSLDNPDAAGDFEEVNEPNVDYQADLETLKGWVTTIEGFKTYLNGENGSVMGRLKAEAKVDLAEIDVDRYKSIQGSKKTVRKAGLIAAAGQTAAGGILAGDVVGWC